jgi:hypothetical protein
MKWTLRVTPLISGTGVLMVVPKWHLRVRSAVVQFRSRTGLEASSSANCAEAIGSGLRSAYLVAVLPYPHARAEVHKAALCLRENAVVCKRPECWTCSWCVCGTDTMVSTGIEARHCPVRTMPTGRKKQDGANMLRRAA